MNNYEHPNDPRRIVLEETPEYESMRNRLLQENVIDIGLLREALGEIDDSTAIRISKEWLDHNDDNDKLIHVLNIGRIIYVAIERYCEPTVDDVSKALGEGRYE